MYTVLLIGVKTSTETETQNVPPVSVLYILPESPIEKKIHLYTGRDEKGSKMDVDTSTVDQVEKSRMVDVDCRGLTST